MVETVSRREVLAFRLSAHHLDRRVRRSRLLDVAGRCGIQNSPPGSEVLALHARVQDVTQELVATAVGTEKTLLQAWCMRGAPFVFPTTDAPVFTTGVLPPTEQAMRHFILGVHQALAKLGIGLAAVVGLCRSEISSVLSGRAIAIDELGRELARAVARRLATGQRTAWEGAGPYAPGQPLGEGVVRFCLRILTLERIVCFAARDGNRAPLALVEDWLGRPIPDIDPDAARAELLRRYLRCYGPSTAADFAAWLGVNPKDSDPWWSLVHDELTPVDFAGRSWMLTESLGALASAPSPAGVRLLPPHDPYLQLRDRETIVDKLYHRELWKAVGPPGAVLVGGEIVGTWRPRKSGRKLVVRITTFRSLAAPEKRLIQDEAQHIGVLRGASTVVVDDDPEE